MIRKITVTNYLNESIELELGRPELTGLLISNVTGLEPAKADINTTEITSTDGSLFNSARVLERNIVMSIIFLMNPTIEDTRLLCYKYFPIKKHVTLLIETDNRKVRTVGYVESNKPNIFSKQETATISIICPDPWFHSTDINTTIFYGVVPMFEFPFSNESLTEPLIEFGEIRNETQRNIVYNGEGEPGIVIYMNFIGTASGIRIYNLQTRERIFINTDKIAELTGSGPKAGDSITITTVKGLKSASLFRDGSLINILNSIDKNSDWFQLHQGDNLFAYTADDGIEHIQFSIANEELFQGA